MRCSPAIEVSAQEVNFARGYSSRHPRKGWSSRHARDLLVSLCRMQKSVMSFKHRTGWVTLTQTLCQTPDMRDHASGLEHHILHHRLDTIAFGGMTQRRINLVLCVLANQRQQICHHGRALGQPTVGIGLELPMKLLIRGVITVRGNHLTASELLWLRFCATLQYRLGQQQGASVLINVALGESIDPPARIGSSPHNAQHHTNLPDAFTFVQINQVEGTVHDAARNNFAIATTAKQHLIHLGCQIKLGHCVSFHAWPQSRSRWSCAKTQCAHKQCVTPEALDSVKVALSRSQHSNVAFENFTIGHVSAHGNLSTNQFSTLTRLRHLPKKTSPTRALRSQAGVLIKKSDMFGPACGENRTCRLSR